MEERKMDLYFSAQDPMATLMNEIVLRAPMWSGDENILVGIDFPSMNKSIFERFIQKYRAIVIFSGMPDGEYGQTVHLYQPGEFTEPDAESLPKAGPVPKHLVSDNLPFSPSKMAGDYRFKRSEDNRKPDMPKVTEEFFFPYLDGQQPSRFVDVSNSLGALRYLSEIVHKLSIFKVVLMQEGIYVKLAAYIIASNKPAFVMGM